MPEQIENKRENNWVLRTKDKKQQVYRISLLSGDASKYTVSVGISLLAKNAKRYLSAKFRSYVV